MKCVKTENPTKNTTAKSTTSFYVSNSNTKHVKMLQAAKNNNKSTRLCVICAGEAARSN